MSGIFPYIWLKFMVHAGEYTIHGSYGYQVEIYIAYLAITDHWIKVLNCIFTTKSVSLPSTCDCR